MEGKSGSSLRGLAFEQYMSSTQKARYISLAQKLAQRINHLAEDKNTRIRWIWELIQNAKDVPNEFGRCRIRIEIKDDKLIFAHNGDPFRVSDLQSLVAQYSSKKEQNDPNTETTGKYGTGFIVTYILSRKIRIKGLLQMKVQEDKTIKKEQSQDEDIIQMQSEEQIINRRSVCESQSSQRTKNEQQQSQQNAIIIEEDKTQKLLRKKTRANKIKKGSYYQKFDIMLDRDYKDRDQQLYRKLKDSQQEFMKQLHEAEPEPKWQRKQGQLNTQFIYQDIDQAANKMINESMAYLKELFPYALLFNPKIFQIRVIDKRTSNRIKNFAIKRLAEDQKNKLKIFNANILQEGLQPAKKFSLAYIEDKDSYSTIAIPLQIKENSIKLLQIDNKFPKIFKEFPLIGCYDTGFNFAFTSKRFYPNQTRSNLLLQQIQGRDCSKKTKANWQALGSIFQKGLQLYKAVSKLIDSGQQNLFIVSLQNHFTQPVFKNKNMHEIYKEYQKEISEINCIKFRNNSFGTIKKLTFPFGKSQASIITLNNYCYRLNSVFAFILGEETTFLDQKFTKFYPIIETYLDTWRKFIKLPDVDGCIAKLCQFKFAEIVKNANQNKQNALKIIETIYGFLLQHHPNYLAKKNNQFQQKSFILNNNLLFKEMRQSLFIKRDLPEAYEIIGKYLKIDVNQRTVFNKFAKYFTTLQYYGAKEMIYDFGSYFFFYTDKLTPNFLIQLGRFITTFNIKTEAIELSLKLNELKHINESFELQDAQSLLPLSDKVQQEFRLLFEINFMLYINKLITESKSLSKIKQRTSFVLNQNNQIIQWLDSIFKFQENLLKLNKLSEFKKSYQASTHQNQRSKWLIKSNLSLELKWVPLQNLKYFAVLRNQRYQKGNYPDNFDLQVHEKMRIVYNRRLNHKNQQNLDMYNRRVNHRNQQNLDIKQLKGWVLHESINHKLSTPTTFKNQFRFITGLYDSNHLTNQNERIQFLNYIFHLRQATIKNRQLQFKILTFKKIEQKAYYIYPAQTNCIKGYQHQIYLYSLVRKQIEVKAAMEITQEYGSLQKALTELKNPKSQQKKMIKND